MASGVRVAAYNTPEYLRDVGTPSRHATAEADILSGKVAALNVRNKRPAIFFDCDGVLNEEPGNPGVVRPDDVVLDTRRRQRGRVRREPRDFLR